MVDVQLQGEELHGLHRCASSCQGSVRRKQTRWQAKGLAWPPTCWFAPAVSAAAFAVLACDAACKLVERCAPLNHDARPPLAVMHAGGALPHSGERCGCGCSRQSSLQPHAPTRGPVARLLGYAQPGPPQQHSPDCLPTPACSQLQPLEHRHTSILTALPLACRWLYMPMCAGTP